jgi:uncharacterized protein YciI
MGTYVAMLDVSPQMREGNLQRERSGGGMAWPEDIRSVIQAHLDYLKGLKAEGKILVGGPMAAFDWVLIIYRADNLDEAVKLAEGDPAYKSDLLTDCRVLPWHHAV